VDLFVYGTLLFPDVLTVLLGRVPARSPAVADGWRAAALPGRVYPGLVPDPVRRATGLVIGGLTAADIALLDAYEEDDYRLADITLADGTSCPTYVWRRDVLADDWNPRWFADTHLAEYAAHCRRWRAGYRPPP